MEFYYVKENQHNIRIIVLYNRYIIISLDICIACCIDCLCGNIFIITSYLKDSIQYIAILLDSNQWPRLGRISTEMYLLKFWKQIEISYKSDSFIRMENWEDKCLCEMIVFRMLYLKKQQTECTNVVQVGSRTYDL